MGRQLVVQAHNNVDDSPDHDLGGWHSMGYERE